MIRVLSLAVMLTIGVTAHAGDHRDGLPNHYRNGADNHGQGASGYSGHSDGLRQQVESLQAEVDALKQASSVPVAAGTGDVARLPQLYDANGNVIGPVMSSWFGSGYSIFLPVPYQLANGKVIQLSATPSQLSVMPQALMYTTADCSGTPYVQAYTAPGGAWLIEPALASRLPDGTNVYGDGVNQIVTIQSSLNPGYSCMVETPASRTVQGVVPFDPGLDQFTPPFSIRFP
jgi:hypothetical protein